MSDNNNSLDITTNSTNHDDHNASTIQEFCRIIGISSLLSSLLSYILSIQYNTRVQSLKSAVQFDNIHDLYNTLIHNKSNKSLYISISGLAHSNNPIQSTYHNSNESIRSLLWSKIITLYTYTKLIPFTTLSLNDYNVYHISQPKATDIELVTHNNNNTTTATTHRRSLLHSHDSTTTPTLPSFIIPRYVMLTAQHIWSTFNNTLSKIGTYTKPATLSHTDVLHDIRQGKLLKSTTYTEYGIHNDTPITVIGHVKYNHNNNTMTMLTTKDINDIDNNNNDQPTIITDKSYSELVKTESYYLRSLKNITYIMFMISIFSCAIDIGLLIRNYQRKNNELSRIIQLKLERDARIATLRQNKNKHKHKHNNSNNNNVNNNNTSNTSVSDSDSDIDDNLCIICTVNPANCVLLDCFHQCTCQHCSDQLLRRGFNRCPICRAPIIKYRIPIIV